MKNVHQAVWIIAILSLMLGLSIGQLHQQHREIEKMERKTNAVTNFKLQSLNGKSNRCVIFSHDGVRIGSKKEDLRYQEVRNRMDDIRAQVELEKARLEREKARLEEEKNIQEIKRDKTRVIREEL